MRRRAYLASTPRTWKLGTGFLSPWDSIAHCCNKAPPFCKKICHAQAQRSGSNFCEQTVSFKLLIPSTTSITYNNSWNDAMACSSQLDSGLVREDGFETRLFFIQYNPSVQNSNGGQCTGNRFETLEANSR